MPKRSYTNDPAKVARIFKVLSVDTRVRILQLLKGRTLCVGVLATRLGISSGAVSQHLRILRDAGLVIPEKRGYYVHYRTDRQTLQNWNGTANKLLSADDD